MAKVAVSLDNKDMQELNEIIMDKDREGAQRIYTFEI